jgi:hypothetical protein
MRNSPPGQGRHRQTGFRKSRAETPLRAERSPWSPPYSLTFLVEPESPCLDLFNGWLVVFLTTLKNISQWEGLSHISADPGLGQGRGGAWDHRRCGTSPS